MDHPRTARKAEEQAAQTQQHTAGTRPDNPALDAAVAHVTDRDPSITDELEEPRPHLVVDGGATPKHEVPGPEASSSISRDRVEPEQRR